MSSVRAEAMTAIKTRLLTVANVGDGQLWPILAANREPFAGIDPVTGQTYIEDLPQGDATIDTGTGGPNVRWRMTRGMWQLNLCVPANSGIRDAVVLADAIETAFLTGAQMYLADGITALNVDNVTVQPFREANEAGWGKLPLVISYYFYSHT